MYIRNKHDLITTIMASKNVRPAIKRAIEEGRYENLGGFKNLLVGGRGWIVKCWGIRQEWYVSIVSPKNTVIEVNGPPLWTKWEGYKSKNPLYQGDKPDEYRELYNTTRSS